MKKTILNTLILSGIIGSGALSQNTMAYNDGDIILRVGLTNVSPNDSSSNILVNSNPLPTSLTVGSNTQLGINVAYFLSPKLNIELLAATPFTHDVNFSVSDPLGTGNKLGEVTHLPPSVTLNYYINNSDAYFQPYIGAGINYTIFFNEKFSSENSDAGLSHLNLDNSLGLTAQAGFDYTLTKKWHLNASIRWIDIETEASFNVGTDNGKVESIAIDPTVTTLSLGYTF